jgi:hypothetical protein
MKLVDSNRIVKRFAIPVFEPARMHTPHVRRSSYLFLPVIRSAAKDPEGLHPFAAFPQDLQWSFFTIHPTIRHFDRSHSCLCARQAEEIRFPIAPPHDEQKALAETR